VNDGSTDKTEQILKPYMDRIVYRHQENGGPAAARNTGLELATEDYVAFLDADDIWAKNKLKLQLELFRKSPEVEMVIGFLQRVYKRDKKKGFKIFDGDEQGIFVLQLGSTLIRREVFKKVGNFDETMTLSEDLDWFLRSREAGMNVEVHKEIVQLYRQHEMNITKNRKAANRFMLMAYKKSLDRRRKAGDDFPIHMPSFKHLDEIVQFWKNNEVTS
jgi:glycosyltransferase involved in cell wall biosynthesis